MKEDFEIDLDKSQVYCSDCLHMEVCGYWPSLRCNCDHKLTAQPADRPASWVQALQSAFHVSRRTAKDMYHALCVHKARDNFRKQFEGSTNK